MNIGNLDNQLIVDNFWEDAETVNLGLIPLTLVMNIKPEKILGLAKFDGSKYILRTFEIEKKKIRTFEFGMSAKELGLGESQFSVVSIDKSQRTNLFFTAFNINRQSPRIVQTKITKDGLQSVSSISIEAQNFKQINKISSFQIGKHEYILASGTNSLVLLVSKDKVISTLHIFVDLVAGEIVDSCICRNKFFSVSPGYPFIVEVTANNKVDEKELQEFQKHYHSEEMKDEIHYERYNISKLEMANNKFNRLDVTKKGDVLYAIGKGIMAITGLNSSKPIKSEVFFENKQFCLVKSLRSGNILLQDTKSNDLIELTSTLKEVKRLKGQTGIVLQNDSFRCARHSHDETIIPWVRGDNLVSLVTMKDLSMKEVKQFYGQGHEVEVIPLVCLCNAEGDKMFGTSLLQSKMRLSYWEKSCTPKYHQLNELYPNIGIILSADASQDSSALFLGGSTNFDFKRGQAILQAVNFNKKLTYITDILLSESDNCYVSKVKRIEDTNRLLVATSKSVYIYEFKNQLFNFITVIQNLLPGGDCLADMIVRKNTLFLLSTGTNTVQRIEFASG